MKTELISVLMAVHNEKLEFIREAIESIINQTYENFEFIIVDDYADKAIRNALQQYQEKDFRIRIIHNEKNLGLTKSLNRAYYASKGKYLARMDADDISVKNRFQMQYEWMDGHPDVAILGGINVDLDKRTYHHGYLVDDMERLKVRMLFQNVVFGHPTAFIRRDFLEQNELKYDETLSKSQDYGLWSDVILHGGIIRSIPKILILKRKHMNQISNKNKEDQLKSAIEIRKRLWMHYGFSLTSDELQIIIDLVAGKYIRNKTFETIQKILHGKSKLNKRQKHFLKEEILFYYLLAMRGLKEEERYSIQELIWRMNALIPRNAVYILKKSFFEPRKICALVKAENEMLDL